jgi:hypothetical protein
MGQLIWIYYKRNFAFATLLHSANTSRTRSLAYDRL